MVNGDFNDLSDYVTKLNNVNLYDDKVDVNEVENTLLSTHVTASDLNAIKDTLSTLVDNVNDINTHLINHVCNDGSESHSEEETITNSLNEYLADQYVRKQQILVDDKIANDSVINFDNYYLRHKNIFIDGYKVSPTSPYNLVSFNQLTLTINGLTGSFLRHFDTLRNQIINSINNSSNITIGHQNLLGWGGGVILTTTSYEKDQNNNIDFTAPLQAILDSEEYHINWVYNSIYEWWFLPDHNTLINVVDESYRNYLHCHVNQSNEWCYRLKLIANGWAALNSNEILDPQYKEFKYYRVYPNMARSNQFGVTLNFDPTYRNVFIGNNFPISTSINSINKGSFNPTEPNAFDKYHFVVSGYYMPRVAAHETDQIFMYENRMDKFYTGYNQAWMECGGQQRVYAWKEGNFIRFSPSTILFPFPFDKGWALQIQTTLKRDIVEPFPFIIPISVVKEDTYYFDIVGGGQGIPDGTTGFFYLKWEAKGMFLVSNLELNYYFPSGYNGMYDTYTITNGICNNHYGINKDIAVEAGFETEELFRIHTKKEYLSLLYEAVLQPAVKWIIDNLPTTVTRPADTALMNDVFKNATYGIANGFAGQYWYDKMDIMAHISETIPIYQAAHVDILSGVTWGEFKNSELCPSACYDYIDACLQNYWPDSRDIRKYWLSRASSAPSSYFELNNKMILETGSLHVYGASNGYDVYEPTYPADKRIDLLPNTSFSALILIDGVTRTIYYDSAGAANELFYYYDDNSTKTPLEYQTETVNEGGSVVTKYYYIQTAILDDDRLKLRRYTIMNLNQPKTWIRYTNTELSSKYYTAALSYEDGDYYRDEDF